MNQNKLLSIHIQAPPSSVPRKWKEIIDFVRKKTDRKS